MTSRRPGARQQRRQQVQHACLPIPLPVTPTPTECGALLKALIKHLLFQRAQIPYLYDELLRAAQEQQRSAAEAAMQAGGGRRRPRANRMPSGDRRLLKFLGKTEELMASIDAALASFGVPRRAFLLLGPSTSRPREAYEVVLPMAATGLHPAATATPATAGEAAGRAGEQPAAMQSQQPATDPGVGGQAQAQPQLQGAGRPKLSRQERLCLLMARQLIVAGADLPEGTAHRVPCKLFVLLEGDSTKDGSSAEGSDGAAAAFDNGSCVAVDGSGDAVPSAPRGFAVKRQFKLAMRKGMHLKLLLGQPQVPQPVAAPEPLQRDIQEKADDADSSSDMEMGGSCSEDEGAEAGPATEHLSQLPDAAATASQQQPSPEQPAAAPIDTAGSIWYLCKTTLKGLNSGSQDDGTGG